MLLGRYQYHICDTKATTSQATEFHIIKLLCQNTKFIIKDNYISESHNEAFYHELTNDMVKYAGNEALNDIWR